MHAHPNRSRRGRLVATLALATGLLSTTVAGTSIADAAPASARPAGATWAPHLDRSIVSSRTTMHGSQLATWYGPGFFGRRTACGQTLRRGTWGIAHRTLPCGTMVTLVNRGRRISVPVIDRGPYSGATVDLTARTKQFLRFTSGTVRMIELRRYRLLPRRS